LNTRLGAIQKGGRGAAARLHSRGRAVERVGDGSERAERAPAADEIFCGGAKALDAESGAHVLYRRLGIEDGGDFVPRGFVDGSDAVEVETLDEEVVEEVVEFGVQGKAPKGERTKFGTRNSEFGMRECAAEGG
jgi:hypothetical protein